MIFNKFFDMVHRFDSDIAVMRCKEEMHVNCTIARDMQKSISKTTVWYKKQGTIKFYSPLLMGIEKRFRMNKPSKSFAFGYPKLYETQREARLVYSKKE